MRRLLIILLLIPLFTFGQTDLLPTVAWRTYVRNVEQLTDSTYKFDVMPLDWNQPGAATINYGNYFQDYGGNKYEVIDSAYLSVTVKDIFKHGVSPQVDRIGVMYETPDPDSKYLAPINYQYLDETAMDNARAIELAYLWKQANLYAKDSSYLVWWKDTIQDIGTKYDIDTLNQKTIDSLLIHRIEIDELKQQGDSLSENMPRFATITEAIVGNDSTTIMSPRTNRDSDTLLYVPFYGAAENVYSDHNATFDTLKSQAMEGIGVRNVAVLPDGSLIDTILLVEETNPVYAGDSSYIKSNIRDWLNSTAYGITGTDTTYWNNKVDDVSDIEANIQTLLDSLNYYLLTTDFNDSLIVLRSEIPTLLTQLDSAGFTITESQISDLQPYLIEADLQPLKDTIKINSDSIDVLANLINDIETITELADVLEAQAGISNKLMTALRTAEQLTLNAVSYYNVREDIYSNFDATFDSIFASNLYQENVSVDATGTGGVYNKEVETSNIEVFLNGVLQRENVHFTQTETQITFIMTPLADDYVTIKYKQ